MNEELKITSVRVIIDALKSFRELAALDNGPNEITTTTAHCIEQMSGVLKMLRKGTEE